MPRHAPHRNFVTNAISRAARDIQRHIPAELQPVKGGGIRGVIANIPLLVPSRDFIALKLQLEASRGSSPRRARRIADAKLR
jgi:hypothetical protein